MIDLNCLLKSAKSLGWPVNFMDSILVTLTALESVLDAVEGVDDWTTTGAEPLIISEAASKSIRIDPTFYASSLCLNSTRGLVSLLPLSSKLSNSLYVLRTTPYFSLTSSWRAFNTNPNLYHPEPA